MVRPAFVDVVERDHSQSDAAFRRRRVVVGVVVALGALLLGLSFATPQGDPRFYVLTLLLATVYVVGSLVSGPLHLGHITWRGQLRRPLLTPTLVGLALVAAFVLGALVMREIPVLAGLTEDVLGYARFGSFGLVLLVTVVNGVAEEIFYRGALFAAIGRRHAVLVSTVLYALATAAGGNLVLVFAAAVLGTVTGLQRRAGGGVLAPIITHVVWSVTMLFVLPPLFAGV